MHSFREEYRGQWKRPLIIVSILVLAASTWVVWTITSAEHIRTFRPTLYRVSGDQRTLTVYPGTCGATFTSVPSDETLTAVRVWVRGKGDTNNKCAQGVTVHLRQTLRDRSVLDGSTGKAMRLWR
jgi:hypothetical protein